MVLEVATVLLGVCVGAVAVLYAAPRGYLGHPRRKGSSAAVEPVTTTTTVYEAAHVEQVEAPAEVAPAPAEPAPAPAPALYETVQPAVTPAPVSFAPSPVATFGASTATKKPTRTYRRRAAPMRGTASSRPTRTTRKTKR